MADPNEPPSEYPPNVIRAFHDSKCNATDCQRQQTAPGRWTCATCGQRIRILYQVTGIGPDERPSIVSRFPACPLQPLKE